jgi:hypothetical protein
MFREGDIVEFPLPLDNGCAAQSGKRQMSRYEVDPTEECSAIVLYGISADTTAAERLYDEFRDSFRNLGYSPDRLGIAGVGFAEKLGPFAGRDAQLRKLGFGDVESFEMICSTPNPRSGHDYFLIGNFDRSDRRSYADIVVRSSIATLSTTSLLPVARRMIEILQPAYGISFTREHRFAPELYSVGVLGSRIGEQSSESYEERRNISRWLDMGMVDQVYREGLLRDVYRWNFLTRPQLDRPVGDVTLEHWIKQTPQRGTLNPFCDGISLWEVDDAQMAILRKALRDADTVFDWRKYVQVKRAGKSPHRSNS